MNILYVFIVSTGIYNILWDEERILSLNYLFPNYDKNLIVISDKDMRDEFGKYLSDDWKDIKYYHICNFVYPFVTLHKFNYIIDACKVFGINKSNYFLYLDAHSLTLEHNDIFWNNIYENHIYRFDICYAINPYLNNIRMYNDDKRSKHIVTEEMFCKEKLYTGQSSFLLGKLNALCKLNNEINQLLIKDIQYSGNPIFKQSILPDLVDQHYTNYIYYNYFLNHRDYGFSIHNDFYITANEINSCTFIKCHYYGTHASEILNMKRNSLKYHEGY